MRIEVLKQYTLELNSYEVETILEALNYLAGSDTNSFSFAGQQIGTDMCEQLQENGVAPDNIDLYHLMV